MTTRTHIRSIELMERRTEWRERERERERGDKCFQLFIGVVFTSLKVFPSLFLHMVIRLTMKRPLVELEFQMEKATSPFKLFNRIAASFFQKKERKCMNRMTNNWQNQLLRFTFTFNVVNVHQVYKVLSYKNIRIVKRSNSSKFIQCKNVPLNCIHDNPL